MNYEILRQKFRAHRQTSDERINRHTRDALLGQTQGIVGGFADAAVLIPIHEGPADFEILFTERAAHLKNHGGQISFPGGRHEAGDLNLESTALRETQEETGIHPDLVEIIGHLPRMYTISYYDVDPVVGLVRPGFELVPDRSEVESIFSVPLSYFADSHHQKIVRRKIGELEIPMVEFSWEGHRIWGATAVMLTMLIDVLWDSESVT